MPITEGLNILYQLLNKGGTIIVCEENGHNWIAYLKYIRDRGIKRISSYYDERLKKITFGNENTLSFQGWLKVFSKTSFEFNQESLNYIRFYFPKIHNKKPYL